MLIKYDVTIRNYQFDPPSQITSKEFEYWKQLIKADPKAKLNTHINEIKLKEGLGIAAFIAFSPIMLWVRPGYIGGEIRSQYNRIKANREEDRFYAKLKELVISSITFDEFAIKIRKEFDFYK